MKKKFKISYFIVVIMATVFCCDLFAQTDEQKLKVATPINFMKAEDPTPQGWEMFWPSGIYSHLLKGIPLKYISKKGVVLKAEESDSIHFNITKRSIPIRVQSTLGMKYQILNDVSPNADLSNDKKDDGALQMLLFLGPKESITHVLIVAFAHKNQLQNMKPQIGYLPTLPSDPTPKLQKRIRKLLKDPTIQLPKYKVLKEHVKFISFKVPSLSPQKFEQRLMGLLSSVFSGSEKAVTHLHFLGLEATAVKRNCADDNDSLVHIQEINVF